MRDHSAIKLEEFNGYYNRGDTETVPNNYFVESINNQYSETSFRTRFGIDLHQAIGVALDNVLRIHPYTMQTQQSLLVMTTGGNIHHVVSPAVVHLNILQIATMTDFNAESIAGRAYITPFFTDSNGYEKGLQNEFLYVYKGDGTAARKAAGQPPTSGTPLVATASGVGFSDLGFKVFAVVYETDTGYLTSLGPATFGTATSISNTIGFDISNIPISPDIFVIKKHIVATKTILNYNEDQNGYQFFFVPNGDMSNATTTKHVDFFDIDLLDDASHLIDNFSEIPAGVGLNTFHGRLVLTTTFTDISVAYVSTGGEPEAINQVDGVLIVPLDGLPLTNCQEYRDVLYLFKKTRTVGYADNDDVPATWKSFIVDESMGCPVHGISTVLDSGGVDVDFLLVANFSGVNLFNGGYNKPELSYNIENYWLGLDRTLFRKIEMVNDSISKVFYIVLPDNTLLIGNYKNGTNPDNIRWSKWTFAVPITTLELINTTTTLFGATVNASSQSGLYQLTTSLTHDRLYNTSDVITNVKIPDPIVQFAYIQPGEHELISHWTGFKIRVVGSGNLIPTLYSLNNVETQVLASFAMSPTSSRIPSRLANFQHQRVSLELKTTVIDEFFKVSRVLIYFKEVFSEFPSVA